MSLVTIIIPVYNVEKYLKKCLDSVVNQTYKNLEIIIVNDASPDLSNVIISEYEKNYKNIKVITKLKNEGLSEARNTGMDNAQGDYIFFLDSDDWISVDTIEKLLFLVQKYESPIVNCAYTNTIGTFEFKKNPGKIIITQRDLTENKDLLLISGTVWNKLYKHNIFENLRFPKGLWYEDNAFIYPLITKVKSYTNTNEIFYCYRRHINSITLSTKTRPNIKVFDRFTIGDFIKEKCLDFGTYEEFEDQIETIRISKAMATLLEISTWFCIPLQERIPLIAYVYQYLCQKYNIKDILEIPYVKARMQQDKIYKYRVQFLMGNLKIAQKFYSFHEEPLEEAKRIITKYKR